MINPFDANVVAEPREAEKPVPGVNDNAYLGLLDAFEALEVPSSIGLAERIKAQLIVSPDRGYGKSHLLGRLFQTLRLRANCIYLRPFEEASRPWQSILMSTMHEMNRPPSGGMPASRNPSQIEIFMIHVLARLTADVLEAGQVSEMEDAAEVAARLREQPMLLRGGREMPYDLEQWLPSVMQSYMPVWLEQLAAHGIDLDGREHAWLTAASALAIRGGALSRKQAVLRWLRGEVLDRQEEEAAGLRTGDLDARPEADPTAMNRVAKRRLCHLCRLAGYHQPFVFCFDQTEYYSSDQYLARALGDVVEVLYSEFPHQMTIVTTNSDHWRSAILPHLAPPHRDRFSFPIPLRGLERHQAMELVTNRLRRGAANADTMRRFDETQWWEEIYGGLPERSPREILMRAGERWRAIHEEPVKETQAPDLPGCLQQYERDFLKKPSLIRFNEDALIWVIRRVAGQTGESTSGLADENRYFRYFWRNGNQVVAFCLEWSDNAKRWGGIVREARSLRARARPLELHSIALRSEDLDALPRPGWQEIRADWDEAVRHRFRVETVSRERLLTILCGREMFSDAMQGSLEGWTPDRVLNEMREELDDWFQTLWDPASSPTMPRALSADDAPAGVEPDVEKREALVALVKKHRSLSLNEAGKQLGVDAGWIVASLEGDPHVRLLSDGDSVRLLWEHIGM